MCLFLVKFNNSEQYKHHWKSTYSDILPIEQLFYFFPSNTHSVTSSETFSNTLNFLLIWSLVLPISLAMASKSVPYILKYSFNLLISALDQLAITTFLMGLVLALIFSMVLTS